MEKEDSIDFFQQFVTDAVLEVVVEQTNLFTQQFYQQSWVHLPLTNAI